MLKHINIKIYIISFLLIVVFLLLSVSSCGSNDVELFMELSEDEMFDDLYRMYSNHDDFQFDSITMYRTEKALIYYVEYSGSSLYAGSDEREPFSTNAIFYFSIEDGIYDYQGRVSYKNKNGANQYEPERLLYIVDEYNNSIENCTEKITYSEDDIAVALAEAETREKNDSTSVDTTTH